VQRELSDRGGAFRSREVNHSKHKSLREVWRDAKIALANAVAKFEDLITEGNVSEQDVVKIREALEIWESKKVVLSRVPGVVYTEGAEEQEPSEEDKEVARLMIELLKMALEKEMTAEEKQGAKEPMLQQSYSQERPVRLTLSFNSRSERRKETSAAPHARTQDSATEAQHAQPTTPGYSSHTNTNKPRIVSPRSILKRHASESPASSPTSSSQHRRKRAHTASFATLSPEALSIANPSPL
jgi:hypothetical protein